MKKKIIGIFVMTLLIATSVQAIGISINLINRNSPPQPPEFPPLAPTAPSGPIFGLIGVPYFYHVLSNSVHIWTSIAIEVDWDDGSRSLSPAGGQPVGFWHVLEHHWNNPGTYDIKARGIALNPFGPDWDGPWSPTWRVEIIDPNANDPPNTPNKPSGPTFQMYGTYTYSTSATDPDGDDLAYKFNFDDGSPLEWTSYSDSGDTVSVTHTFESPGIYDIRVKAKDENGQESGWSNALEVWLWTFVPIGNEPPNTPQSITSSISGPYDVGDTVTYFTSTTDLEGDKIAYKFDFSDIDYSGPFIPIVQWTSYYNSGFSASRSHQWTRPGFWSVKAKAKDIHGQTSDWSIPHLVIVNDNDPPNKPFIEGPEYGRKNVQYIFSASSSDPQSDQIRYGWDVDNDYEIDFYSDYFNSGQIATRDLKFDEYGQYVVRAMAEDEHSLEGDWSDPIIITINLLGIRSKQIINSPFIEFLENHPNLFPLLQKILGI
jgi:hypothetical protein